MTNSYSLTSYNGLTSEDYATIMYLRKNKAEIPGTKLDSDVNIEGANGLGEKMAWESISTMYSQSVKIPIYRVFQKNCDLT